MTYLDLRCADCSTRLAKLRATEHGFRLAPRKGAHLEPVFTYGEVKFTATCGCPGRLHALTSQALLEAWARHQAEGLTTLTVDDTGSYGADHASERDRLLAAG